MANINCQRNFNIDCTLNVYVTFFLKRGGCEKDPLTHIHIDHYTSSGVFVEMRK